MIKNRRELKEYLKADLRALYPNGTSCFSKIKDPVLKFQILLRKCEYYKNTSKVAYLNPIYIFLKYRMRNLEIKLNFSIPENCFDAGLSIAHYGSIIVNPNARIGKNCRIHVGVNIGANKNAEDVPIIGDNVYIGPGAKIFGKIKIGDNVKIGANSVVNKDFQGNVVIAGVPAKIISYI